MMGRATNKRTTIQVPNLQHPEEHVDVHETRLTDRIRRLNTQHDELEKEAGRVFWDIERALIEAVDDGMTPIEVAAATGMRIWQVVDALKGRHMMLHTNITRDGFISLACDCDNHPIYELKKGNRTALNRVHGKFGIEERR